MGNTYQEKLFANYSTTHVSFLDSDDSQKQLWFSDFVKRNIWKFISAYDFRTAKILEIGCNKGYLLTSLKTLGCKNLFGIDLSPVDVEAAKKREKDAVIECVDASSYLQSKPEHFDIIILKAVLEHVDKNSTLELLGAIRASLKPSGILIIDVPNMDWIFASHERYMDFTHETGFTKESLAQVLRTLFAHVEIHPIDHIHSASNLANFKKFFSRRLISLLFKWADPEGGNNPIWARSIMAIAQLPQKE